eukprot:363142-Chlamydomonas_euryale.AAC.3
MLCASSNATSAVKEHVVRQAAARLTHPHGAMQNLSLGVSIRDMRLMDSHFVNYDTIGQIAVRENTIVFSIEHVKALITPDKVVLPIEEDRPSEVQVSQDLKEGLERWAAHAGNILYSMVAMPCR